MYPAVIIRHPKERLSKCSLQALLDRTSLTFIKAKTGLIYNANDHILLAVDAPVLSPSDAGCPLLLLDSTWRLLPKLKSCLQGEPIRRSLPENVQTAYPRVSKLGQDPPQGLASVEALYLALRLLGARDDSLLEHYHWREVFLKHLETLKL